MKTQHEGISQLDWQAKDSTKYLESLCKRKVIRENRILSHESLNGYNGLLSINRLSNEIFDKTKTFQFENSFPLLNETQQNNKANKQLWINPLDTFGSLDNQSLPRQRCFVQRSAYYVGPNAFNDSANFKTFKIMDFDSDDDCQTAILSRMFKISLSNSDENAYGASEQVQENEELRHAAIAKKTSDLANYSNAQKETFEKHTTDKNSSVYTSMTNLFETLAQISVPEDVAKTNYREKKIENSANKESEVVNKKPVQALYKCRGCLKLSSYEDKETDNNVVLFGIDGTSPNITYTSMNMRSHSKKKKNKSQAKNVGIQVKYSDFVNATKAEMKKTSSNKSLEVIEESPQLNAIKCTPNGRLSKNDNKDESYCENVSVSDDTIDYTSEIEESHFVPTTTNVVQGTPETKPSWQIKRRLYPHLVLPELETKSDTKSYSASGYPSNQHDSQKPTVVQTNISTHDSPNPDYPTLYLSRGFNFASCRGGLRYSKMIHRRKTYQNPY